MLFRFLQKKSHIWFPGYIMNRLAHKRVSNNETADSHIIFLVVDHFEPSRSEGLQGVQKVREWCEEYEKVARSHRDSDGRFPQHTWFYRYDYPSSDCINILNEYVCKGFGEIEFHLHHGNDTPDSFTKKINEGVEWFNKAGAMISAEYNPQRRFGYIAGNWALDNGRRKPDYSGVNTELEILSNAGCYADFTFPAIGTSAQPRKVNSIYYAKDTPFPKSYTTGINVKVRKNPCGDLMIIQGPLYIDWKGRYTESAAFESFALYRPRRIDSWISAGVHVVGRPEWIFVKLHTHGIQSKDSVLGDHLNSMLSDLENRFKKPPYYLHYVTARESYNIIKAAEAGKNGNPDEYRDYIIPPPANRKMFCNRDYQLERYSEDQVKIKILDSSKDIIINFNDLPLKSICGEEIKDVELFYSNKCIKRLLVNGSGKCVLIYSESANGKPRNLRKTLSLPFKGCA